MIVKDAINVDEFFEAVKMCEGKVELVTRNGDRLNLKSTLSQFVSMVSFFSGDYTPGMEIITHNANDTLKLFGYMIN